MPAPPVDLVQQVARAIDEDVGAGDLTAVLVPAGRTGRATVITREAAVLCGRPWFDEVFRQVDPSVRIEWDADEGSDVAPGQRLCRISGPARSLLTGERTALNFLQTLSGTATVTRRYVTIVAGLRARILDTRKTLPGLRRAQKYAVLCAGGSNHRMGLYDGILVKENHIMAAGSIAAAMDAARTAGASVPVEVEVETLDELRQGCELRYTMFILADRMPATTRSLKLASQTALAPFRMSKTAVKIPAHKPAARMAFVPPVRPLAMLRISCPVVNFTINKPKGIEPTR